MIPMKTAALRFHNALRILASIDATDLVISRVIDKNWGEREASGRDQIAHFREDPFSEALRMPDANFDKLFDLIENRHPMPESAGDAAARIVGRLDPNRGAEIDMRSLCNTQSDQWDEASRGPRMSDVEGKTIFKYQMPVLESFVMKLPVDAEIIRVAAEDGFFWMWAIVNTFEVEEERYFRAFKTGGAMPEDVTLKYIGFCPIHVQQELGLYIFERIDL